MKGLSGWAREREVRWNSPSQENMLPGHASSGMSHISLYKSIRSSRCISKPFDSLNTEDKPSQTTGLLLNQHLQWNFIWKPSCLWPPQQVNKSPLKSSKRKKKKKSVHLNSELLIFDLHSYIGIVFCLVEFAMASSELSLILNNANANLYPEPQPHLSMTVSRPPHLSEITFSSSSTMGKSSWHPSQILLNVTGCSRRPTESPDMPRQSDLSFWLLKSLTEAMFNLARSRRAGMFSSRSFSSAFIVDTVIKTFGVSTQLIVKHTTEAPALETVNLSGYSSIVSETDLCGDHMTCQYLCRCEWCFEPVLQQAPGTRWTRRCGPGRTFLSGSPFTWRTAGLMPVCWIWTTAAWTASHSARRPKKHWWAYLDRGLGNGFTRVLRT